MLKCRGISKTNLLIFYLLNCWGEPENVVNGHCQSSEIVLVEAQVPVLALSWIAQLTTGQNDIPGRASDLSLELADGVWRKSEPSSTKTGANTHRCLLDRLFSEKSVIGVGRGVLLGIGNWSGKMSVSDENTASHCQYCHMYFFHLHTNLRLVKPAKTIVRCSYGREESPASRHRVAHFHYCLLEVLFVSFNRIPSVGRLLPYYYCLW